MKRSRILTCLRYPFIIIHCVFLFTTNISSNNVNAQVVIHGTIRDRSTGEALFGATIYDTISKQGTVANEYGFYSLKLNHDRPVLCCSYVGYSPAIHIPDLTRDSLLNISLSPDLKINEITITGTGSKQDFLSSQMSFHRINAAQIKKLPTLFGEIDMVKALQYLPGVSSGIEGSSGIYVRGGGSDQNLILLDGVPVYNVNHLFGFFSVFNGEAVNSATLYKAGFPARYSGRLSSVIDIRMKEGNNQKFHGSASIGLISSSIMLEGPIIKENTSFLVSARRTYIDILSYPVQYLINRSNHYESYLGYYFQDLNAKINHKFSDKSRIFLSTYAGKDEFYMLDEANTINTDFPSTPVNPDPNAKKLFNRDGFNWGNFTNALRWNYIWGNRFFSNATLSYSNYRFNNFNTRSDVFIPSDSISIANNVRLDYKWSDIYYSGIKDLSIKADFTFVPSPQQTIRFGAERSGYFFEPGVSISKTEWEDGPTNEYRNGGDTVLAQRFTAFLEDEFSLGDRFTANIGLSSTLFNVEETNYISFEPRISARLILTSKMLIKASYAEMSQPIHLLTNSIVGLPTDVWVPTTKNIAPERSKQVALGLKYQISESLKFSWESFYKEMRNLVEYAEGAELFMNDEDWESLNEIGDGTAYGTEFYFEKNLGKFTGSAAYTWSKNFRQFDNIDNGEPFPYKYDRRHDISLVANYQLKKNISLGATWVFASGVNTTIVDQSYQNPIKNIYPLLEAGGDYYQNDFIKNYMKRNGYQLPAYNRLDLCINISKEKKWFERTWSFGVYNAYRRLNASYIYSSQAEVYKVTLFPIIPYFSYSIKF
ncbi:MAG: TonB-dependent receptor [Bacteroidales bacterium]|nr:TonB-dependent receptor [Bacteroidales bacterium]